MIMNIVVCIKQVVDVSQVKVDEASKDLILTGIPFKTSDFDKNAVEEAIKIKEKLNAKLIVMTVGGAQVSESIRESLAMGADEGVILSDPSFDKLDSHGIAKVLATGIQKLGEVSLVLCGEAAIDSYAGQVGPMLGEQLGFPVVTYITGVTAEQDKLVLTRDIGDKLVTVETGFPVLITATKELNEPRLPNMMQILAAANKKIETWGAGELGLSAEMVANKINTQSVKGFSMDRKKILINGEPEEQAGKLMEYIKATISG
jgi:electron transfer flavoprotein beta subunit